MSLANLYAGGNIYLENEISKQSTMQTLNIENDERRVSHSFADDGAYTITDENEVELIVFKDDADLDDCALKTYIDNAVGPVARLTTAHTLTLGEHDDRLTDLESLPNTENIAVLQGQVNALIAYNNKLKQLILALKESLHLSKSINDTNEFDYTGLL